MIDSDVDIHANGRKEFIYFSSLVLCAFLVFFVGLGNRHLWDSDEPRVAGISAEMERTGEVVVPRLNGEPFLEKPPLYFWTASFVFKLFGESTYTARIPSAFAALCGVALVFFLARSMGFSALSSFISGFVLTTSAEYWELGRKSLIDMLLCLFITCAMVCFYQACRFLSKRFSLKSLLWSIAFILSLSCAVMTKGLVGLAIPLSALPVWLILQKNFSFRVWLLLFIGSFLCLVPTGIWVWLLYNKLGWDAVYETVWTNNFGRFTGAHQSHIKPFYYYLTTSPQKFLPWILFLPLALFYYIKDVRQTKSDHIESDQIELDHIELKRGKIKNSSMFFLIWFCVPFLLLSISSAKRGIYLIPLYPAAALFIGTAIGRALEEKKKLTKWFITPSVILTWALILSSFGMLGLCIKFKQPFLICIMVFLPGLILGIWAYIRFAAKDFSGFSRMLFCLIMIIYLIFGYWVYPVYNKFKSYEPLFHYCEELEVEGYELKLFSPPERLRGAVVFYMKKNLPVITKEEDLKKFLHSSKKVAVISVKRKIKNIDGIEAMKIFNVGRYKFILLKKE